MAEVEGKFAYVKRLSVGIYEAWPGLSDTNNAPRDRGDRRASFSSSLRFRPVAVFGGRSRFLIIYVRESHADAKVLSGRVNSGKGGAGDESELISPIPGCRSVPFSKVNGKNNFSKVRCF